MFVQPKNITLLNANPLKDSVAIEKTVIKDRDLRLGGINVFTIQINDHDGLLQQSASLCPVCEYEKTLVFADGDSECFFRSGP